jgi:hypothetical protein
MALTKILIPRVINIIITLLAVYIEPDYTREVRGMNRGNLAATGHVLVSRRAIPSFRWQQALRAFCCCGIVPG